MLKGALAIDEKNFIKELESSLYRKLKRMKKIEQGRGEMPTEDIAANIETGLKSGLYSYFRFLYNNSGSLLLDMDFGAALFYFIREYCYSSMFRYNRKGDFNVPYGGISYNGKYLSRKTEANFMLLIKNTAFIYELYKDFNITSFNKKYVVSFQNRNDRHTEHLLITNYNVFSPQL